MSDLPSGKLEYNYFPKSLQTLIRELHHPHHASMHLSFQDKYQHELNNLDSPVEYLQLLAIELGELLDGEYTVQDVSERLLKLLIKRRRENLFG